MAGTRVVVFATALSKLLVKGAVGAAGHRCRGMDVMSMLALGGWLVGFELGRFCFVRNLAFIEFIDGLII